jgi:hypothetical protein
MPVTDTFALRYPGPYDVVDATTWQNLATDIDSAMSTVDAKRATAVKPNSARVLNNSTQLLTNGVLAILTFTAEDWDNGGLANLGVNNDRLTLGTGLWLVSGGLTFLGMTVVTHVELHVMVNGVSYCQQRIGPLYNGAAPIVQVTGLLLATAATDYVTIQAGWSGTGGPATAFSGYLQATKMRSYP